MKKAYTDREEAVDQALTKWFAYFQAKEVGAAFFEVEADSLWFNSSIEPMDLLRLQCRQ